MTATASTLAQRAPRQQDGAPPRRPISAVPPPSAPGQSWDRLRFSASGSLDPDEPEAHTTVRVARQVEDTPEPTALAPRHAAPTGELPDPRTWSALLARAAVEVLVGIRPATQLARWLTTDLYEAVTRRAGLAIRILGRPRQARRTIIQRARVQEVRAGVQEAAVVVHDGTRTRGVALRLEARRGRWMVTALEIG